MEKIKVLFVCLGNICRSPLAEGLFNSKIKEKGLAQLIEADSCGTLGYHVGSQPDPRTLANAKRNGIEINHCCRKVSADDLRSFDYILAMDRSNLKNILCLDNAASYSNKIFLMRDFDPLGKGDVPDPYHGGEQSFQEVFNILNRALDKFILHLEKKDLKKV